MDGDTVEKVKRWVILSKDRIAGALQLAKCQRLRRAKKQCAQTFGWMKTFCFHVGKPSRLYYSAHNELSQWFPWNGITPGTALGKEWKNKFF